MLHVWAQEETQHVHPQESFSGETNTEAMETIFGYNMEAEDVLTKIW
jgi:hypothetical protein